MPIEFTADRWTRIRENAKFWWAGELKRPLIQMTQRNRDPGRPEPELIKEKYAASYGLDVIVDQLGSSEGIALICCDDDMTEDEMLDGLSRYGAG